MPSPPGGFDVLLPDHLPSLRADAAKLERALANVLDNAVRFAGQAPVSVRSNCGGAWLVLRVSDQGPGIGREELERVFEPFRRFEAGPASGGSGLGLAIARGFVEANEGRLRAGGSATGAGQHLRVPAARWERVAHARAVAAGPAG